MKTVGPVTYLKIKLKKLLGKLSGPSVQFQSGNRTYQYSSKNDLYIKNGKVLKPGTPECEQFKKDMDSWTNDFDKSMRKFSEDMRNVGVSFEEAAKNMRGKKK